MSRRTQLPDNRHRTSKPRPLPALGRDASAGAKVRHEPKLIARRDTAADRRLLGVICTDGSTPLIRVDNGDLYEVLKPHAQNLTPYAGSEVTFTVVGTRRGVDIRFTGWAWTVKGDARRGFGVHDRRRDPSVPPRAAHDIEEHGPSVPCATSGEEHQQ